MDPDKQQHGPRPPPQADSRFGIHAPYSGQPSGTLKTSIPSNQPPYTANIPSASPQLLPPETRRPLPVSSSAAFDPRASERRELLKAKRRVPPSQRKRTVKSCDACKTKRCKCQRLLPSPTAGGSQPLEEEQAPCKACVDAGIECVTTMPRKQRIYGSVESLDRRYRALDALVAGLFSQLPAEATAEELVAFGQSLSIDMPDFDNETEDLAVLPGASLFSARTNLPSTTLMQDVARDLSMSSRSTPSSLGAQPLSIQPSSHGSSFEEDYDPPLRHPTALPRKSGIILDTSGRPHYIGASGSPYFLASLRDLVSKRLGPDSDRPFQSSGTREDDLETKASKFVQDSLADAMGGGPSLPNHSIQQIPHRKSLQTAYGSRERNAVHNRLGLDEGLEHHTSITRIPASKVRLPDRKVADTCVAAFFQKVHPDFLMFHEPTFRQAYENLWESTSGHTTGQAQGAQRKVRLATGWLCCVYLVFILGSRSLPQTKASLDFQRAYYTEVTQLPTLLSSASLPNICAFMLLSLYCHNTNDRMSAWTYHGSACRVAISLGLHREEVSALFDPLHQELRKRVWWTLYGYEQHLCCTLGRPGAIDEREVNITIPNESVLNEGRPSTIQIGEFDKTLSQLLSGIRRELYDPASPPETRLDQALSFLRDLIQWEMNFNSHLGMPIEALSDNIPNWRGIIMLGVRCHDAIMLVTRPFLFRDVESSEEDLGPNQYSIIQLGRVCVSSAVRSINLLVDLWQHGCFNGVTWLDVYYAYSASMILTLRLLVPVPEWSLAPETRHKGKGIVWDTQMHALQRPEVQPITDLDHEANTLAEAFGPLYRSVSLVDDVRKVHDILQHVDMCGTSARFAKVAAEFARAAGIVDGMPLSTLFGAQIGQRMQPLRENGDNTIPGPNLAERMQGTSSREVYTSTLSPQQAPNMVNQAAQYPAANMMSGLDLNYDGNYNAYNYVGGGSGGEGVPGEPAEVQWDMVLQPAQWDQASNLAQDMDWAGWNAAAPYVDYDPRQGQHTHMPRQDPRQDPR